jgi:hypothetical protein
MRNLTVTLQWNLSSYTEQNMKMRCAVRDETGGRALKYANTTSKAGKITFTFTGVEGACTAAGGGYDVEPQLPNFYHAAAQHTVPATVSSWTIILDDWDIQDVA